MTADQIASHNTRIYRARMAALRRGLRCSCGYSRAVAPWMVEPVSEGFWKGFGG